MGTHVQRACGRTRMKPAQCRRAYVRKFQSRGLPSGAGRHTQFIARQIDCWDAEERIMQRRGMGFVWLRRPIIASGAFFAFACVVVASPPPDESAGTTRQHEDAPFTKNKHIPGPSARGVPRSSENERRGDTERRAREHQMLQGLALAAQAAGTDTGACCYNPWGDCIVTTESGCVDGGGRFKGVGTECGELTCQGACCFGSSCLEPYGLGLCVADGGMYQGDGSRCTQLTIDCPPTTGACCVDDSCQDRTPADCDVAGGTFLELGVPCWRVSCTPPEIHGACCFVDGSCRDTSTARCGDAGGTHRGQGTICGGGICTGACCFFWGCLDGYAPFWCALDGGDFQGLGTRCDLVECPSAECVTDADCPDDGLFCTGTELCDGAGSCYSDGDPCSPGGVCDEDLDLCFVPCTADADCDDGNPCTDDTCGDANTCINQPVLCPDGEVCDAETGQCVPDTTNPCEGVTCRSCEICVNGACVSTGNPTAGEAFYIANGCGACHGVSAEGGVGPALVGAACALIFDKLTGADTHVGGTVDGVTQTDTENLAAWLASLEPPPVSCDTNADCDDGLFCNGSETCDTGSGVCIGGSDPCPDDGQFCNGFEFCEEANDACVPSGNPCDSLTELCDEATDTCVAQDTGACCVGAFGCWDDVSAEYCNSEGGDFQGPDTTCDPWPCPPPGACCLGTDCTETSAGQCKQEGGAYQGDDTRCSDANIACPIGACCFQDSTCQMLTVDGCTSRDGSFLGAGRACDFGGFPFGGPIVVTPGEPPVGACPGACCAFLSSACTDRFGRGLCEFPLQGEFQGDGTACTDLQIACPSHLGACCVSLSLFGGPDGGGGAQAGESQSGLLPLTTGGWKQSGPSSAPSHQRRRALAAGVPSGPCYDGITQFECAWFFASLSEFHEGVTCAEIECPTGFCPGLGDCCTPHRAFGCNDESCCRAVCSIDPICCGLPYPLIWWDDICASLANRLCGTGKGHYCADRLADLDGNGLVDLRDYQLFQLQLCPPAACCLPDGSCQEICREICTSRGGQYAGDRLLCGDVTCSAAP